MKTDRDGCHRRETIGYEAKAIIEKLYANSLTAAAPSRRYSTFPTPPQAPCGVAWERHQRANWPTEAHAGYTSLEPGRQDRGVLADGSERREDGADGEREADGESREIPRIRPVHAQVSRQC